MLLWPGVSVDVRRPELVLWFGLMGSLLLAFLGLLTSIWADKFDHAAAVTNFVVTPLSLLSGTFYSVQQLAPDVPEGQPRQPVLLRHLGLPRRLPRRQQFAAAGRRGRVAGPEHRAVGALLCAAEERLEDQELSHFSGLTN